MEKEDLITKYFLEGLSPEEQIVFGQFLEKDAEFKARFEFEKSVQLTIQAGERNALKERLKNIEKDLPRPERKGSFSLKPLSIAASIAILMAIGWYAFNNSTPNASELFVSNFDEYPNTVYAITRGDDKNSPIRRAFVAYEANDHSNAIRLFNELKLSTHPGFIDFYLAQSYLSSGETSKAITLFKKEIANKGEFKDEALWYLALGYLKLEDNENAISSLQELITNGSYKKIEAQDLSGNLE